DGDEFAVACGYVVQRQLHAERLDRDDPRVSVGLQRQTLERALARDRRVGQVEEPQPLLEAAANPDALEVVPLVAPVDHDVEPEAFEAFLGPMDERPVAVGDAQGADVAATAL